MEIKILEVYEEKDTLRVKVETPYGVENLGLGLHNKYLDPKTDKPMWMTEVRKLLDKKYGKLELRQKTPIVEAQEFIGKPMQLDDLAPKDDEIIERERKRAEEVKLKQERDKVIAENALLVDRSK